jgi:hypothetical protein
MHSLKILAPAVVSALLGVAAHAQTASSCRLLVENKNDLWLVRPDGSVISRITSDGQLKPAAALQPGGNLVAYSTLDPTRDIVIADATGRVASQTSSGAGDAVVGLSWPSSAMLRADIHEGPSTSQFQFFSLQPGNRLVQVPLDSARGAACAASPSGRQLACADGDALTLDGTNLYYATGPFDSSRAAQSVNLALGGSVITATSPALQVDFKQQTGTSVTLLATTPDHQSQEQRVSTGSTMPVNVSDAALIGLEPVRTADPNTIKLVVKTSNTGYARFEGGLAWSPNGARIAAVEANDAGQRTLLLLDRQMGQAAIQGQGGIDGRLVLPIAGPIRAIRFLTNTAIRVEGAQDAVEYTVPATGKVRSPSYVVKPLPVQAHALSLTLDGSPVSATVRDWTCP